MDDLFYAILSILDNHNLPPSAISNAIHVIYKSYSKKHINTVQASLIDYNQIAYQCAYIYLYLTSHVNVVYNLFSTFWDHNEVKVCFAKCGNALTVCSIGGGPGSDIFGLNSFIRRFVGSVNISGVVLDHCELWEQMFHELESALKITNLCRMRYHKFEFFMENDFNTKLAVANADVVMLVKFLSAVSFDRNAAEIRLMRLLQYVRPGAIILFADNVGGGYLKLMQRSATKAQLLRIDEVTQQQITIPVEGFNAIELNKGQYKACPQRSTILSASIWYKKDIRRLNYAARNDRVVDNVRNYNFVTPTHRVSTPNRIANAQSSQSYANRPIRANSLSNTSNSIANAQSSQSYPNRPIRANALSNSVSSTSQLYYPSNNSNFSRVRSSYGSIRDVTSDSSHHYDDWFARNYQHSSRSDLTGSRIRQTEVGIYRELSGTDGDENNCCPCVIL